jgi:hypothetical protein
MGAKHPRSASVLPAPPIKCMFASMQTCLLFAAQYATNTALRTPAATAAALHGRRRAASMPRAGLQCSPSWLRANPLCGRSAGPLRGRPSMAPQSCACRGVLPLRPALLHAAGCSRRVHTARLGCARNNAPVVAHPTRGRPARRGPQAPRTVDGRWNRSSRRLFPTGRKNRSHRMPPESRRRYNANMDPPPAPPGPRVDLRRQLTLPPTPTR